MSFDIIGDLTFGSSFKCLDTQANHWWVDMVFGSFEALVFMGACNRFTISRIFLPYLIPKKHKAMIEDHWNATEEALTRRMELGTKRRDLMSPVLENNVDGKGLNRHEILSNAWLFVNAGSETTAGILSATIYYLARDPRIMSIVTAEIRGRFSDESQINVQSVAQLPYFLACLSETNRILPAALIGQAVLVPSQGATICGYWVPGKVGMLSLKYLAALETDS